LVQSLDVHLEAHMFTALIAVALLIVTALLACAIHAGHKETMRAIEENPLRQYLDTLEE
jgi:hypothetical protein